MNLKFVIDGYNLLHASPLIETRNGPKWLENQRLRLLNALASLLSPNDRLATLVVFDARESPKGIPSEYCFDGIAVRFARDHAEADDLIEELIDAHANTSSLTVVSSDLRLQRAAKRRKAAFFESRVWFDQLQESRRAIVTKELTDPERIKDQVLGDEDVAQWLEAMGMSDASGDPPKAKSAPSKSDSEKHRGGKAPPN